MKNLIIVESPAKAKTIEKFLGSDYKVMSSVGHVRDLRKKDFSIDVDANFKPIYEIPADHRDIVKQLKSAASKADTVWLASDEDREGEAIAWHLYEVLGLKPENTKRIVFHEITKPAILHAIENPRDIDIHKVNAQQARRVLDRIVGFELSPVLWRKIKPALSAGRVQSVAVRLICEREKEIKGFVPEPFFRVTGEFEASTPRVSLKGELNTRFIRETEARDFLDACKDATFAVRDVTAKPVTRSPQPPFTTSTLQQEASRRLSMSVSRTMMVAQQLYEAGHITYMRTDSLNLSELAVRDIAKRIDTEYGKGYSKPRHWHTHSKGAQEAHEAIRPTYINVVTLPDATPQMQSLYTLIRQRTLASQMADAQLQRTNVEIGISTRTEHFMATGERITFPGFLKAYGEEEEKNSSTSAQSAATTEGLKPGTSLTADIITATERFTQAPPRYSEATLVKKMEELGIGRPSTYAPTISTIQTRGYVERGEKEGEPRPYVRLILSKGKLSSETLKENTGSERGKLIPTDVGMVVNDFLTEFFPDILDYNFTANVEEKFDHIAEGKIRWEDEMKEFYHNFHPDIEKVSTMRMEHKVGERQLGHHPETGKPVSVKIGRYGPLVQIGDPNDEEKPMFASLLKGQSVGTITLEEALKLFELPRTVGEYEGKTVVAAIGRFGPYIRHDGKFVSIPKDMAPLTISLPEAIELIESKRKAEADKLVKQFPEEPGLEVVNGRYGVYLAYKPAGAKKAKNYKIPKGTDGASLTIEEARKLMEAQDKAPATVRKSRSTKG